MIDYVGPFLLMLGVLVVAHEIGHFCVAKLFGVRIERFSVGFGPSLLSRTVGGTEYVLAWLPLGGYVKMLGEAPDEELSPEERKCSFNGQSPWRRMGISLAGPAMNLLLPIPVIAALLITGWPTPTTLLGSVPPDSPAASAGLVGGDRIVSIDGQEVWRWRELTTAIRVSAGRSLVFGIERDGTRFETQITPGRSEPGAPLRIGVEQARAAAVIGVFDAGGVAAAAGLRTGDRVVSLDGQPIEDWYSLRRVLDAASGPLAMKIERPLGDLKERVDLEVPGAEAWSLERLGVQQIRTAVRLVEPMSPARRAGVEVGDIVLAIDGDALRDEKNLQERIAGGGGAAVELDLLRGSERVTVSLTPLERTREVDGSPQTAYAAGWYIGVPRAKGEMRDDVVRNPMRALWRGAAYTTDIFKGTVQGIGMLITGKVGVENLAGPIGIGEIAGDSFKEGWLSFLTVLCVISVNLAILNLLPIPILDGGHVIFAIAELVQGGPVGVRAREIAQTVGLSLIILLMGFAFWNDLSRQWSGIVGFFSGLV